MTLKDIKKAVNVALKSEYPGFPCYGVDIVEGYKQPCFFVIASENALERTKNAVHKTVEIEIQYIQKTADELNAISFFQRMEQLFGGKLVTEKRQLSVMSSYQDFAGEHGEIPVFGFVTEFWQALERTDNTTTKMGEVVFRQEEK